MIDKILAKKVELTDADKIGERRAPGGRLLCYYCGQPLKENKHAEHVFPRALGGPNLTWNLVWACPTCNHRKHAKHPLAWLEMLSPDWPLEVTVDFLARLLIGLNNSMYAPGPMPTTLKGTKLELEARDLGLVSVREYTHWPVVVGEAYPAPGVCPECGQGGLRSKCSHGTFLIRVNCQGCGLVRVLEAYPGSLERKGTTQHD